MADVKTPAAKAPAVPQPKSEAVTPPKAEKKERVKWQQIYPSAEAAAKEAGDRTKGPRRAFQVDFNGKSHFIVSHNEVRAAGIVLAHLGGSTTELGKKARATKAVTPETIRGQVEALAKADPAYAKVLEQLNALMATKK
jgi:hypothetical protein